MPVPGLYLLGLKRIRGFVSILRYINPTIIISVIGSEFTEFGNSVAVGNIDVLSGHAHSERVSPLKCKNQTSGPGFEPLYVNTTIPMSIWSNHF